MRHIPCVVHWYSCMEHLERYLDLDSWFTVGPGVFNDPAVREVARRALEGRVLVETDGLSAVAWALEREVGAGGVAFHPRRHAQGDPPPCAARRWNRRAFRAAEAYAEVYGVAL